jgi:hypothetical protein
MKKKTMIYLGVTIGVILVLTLSFLIFSNSGITGNIVNENNNEEIIVFTRTNCPECRDALNPYLDDFKNSGIQVEEYMVDFNWAPKISEILKKKGLTRPNVPGFPLVCINKECIIGMGPIKEALNKFKELKLERGIN